MLMWLRNDNNVARVKSKRIETSICSIVNIKAFYADFWAAYDFSGNFSTYTHKYVNKTSHFASNHCFGHNERQFHCEFQISIKVYMISNRHFIPDRVFNPE